MLRLGAQSRRNTPRAEYAQIGYSARPLRLARHAYDALPGDVKAILQGAKAN
jgi:hypothetical protein